MIIQKEKCPENANNQYISTPFDDPNLKIMKSINKNQHQIYVFENPLITNINPPWSSIFRIIKTWTSNKSSDSDSLQA